MSVFHVCELFRRCLDGSGDDWREFVQCHGPRVRRMVSAAARQCGVKLQEPDLDELVQELYCRLLMTRYRRRFQGGTESEFWRFIGQVGFNLVVDRKRSVFAKKRRPEASGSGRRPRRSPTAIDPEQRLLGKEGRKIFLQRCREITRCDRMMLELQALGLAFLDGWSSREIAVELGVLSVRQIDSLVFRLRRHLAKDGIQLPRRVGVPMVAHS